MKARPLILFAALLAIYALAGCGGGGESSSAGPATIAPADSSVFVEATVRPQGTVKSNIESLAKNVAGIDDLGGKIVSEVEKSARADGEPFNFDKEVEPWLGEEGAVFLTGYDGENFRGHGFLLQSTDTAATEEFIESQSKTSKKQVKAGTFEGVKYKSEVDGSTIGVVGNFLVVAGDLKSFEEVVNASNGETLAEGERYSKAIAEVPSGSLASVYVDIGSLVKQGGPVNPQAELFLQAAGIDPSEATATASLVPGTEQIEVDLSTDLTGENPPSGNASDLLGSMPAESLAAFVSPEFGKELGKAIDGIDANGIPGQVPPHTFKETLKSAGINLDQIAGSIGDLGLFVEGTNKNNLDGAAVLTTNDASQAASTVSRIGLLLRASHTPGVTAIGGQATGFSVRSSELGQKPLVVAAEGERIVIGYGLPAASLGLSKGAQTLADTSAYKEAVSALSGTPITGFVDGPAALRLAESLVPPSETGFQEAKPYLGKISFVAEGGGVADGRTTAKLIVDFKK